jgi:hypothetical protein
MVKEDVIHKNAFEIRKTMIFHARVEKCLQLTALFYNLYSIYSVISPFFDYSERDGSFAQQVDHEKKVANESSGSTINLRSSIKSVPWNVWNFFKAIPRDFLEVIVSGQLFRSLGTTIGNCLLISVTNCAIQSAWNKVAHNHTIKWYVQTHAPYQQAITLSIKQIEEYERKKIAGVPQDGKELLMIVSMCNLLLKHIESVLSYMTFRVPTITRLYQKEALLVKELFFNYIIDWQTQLRVSLQEDNNATMK